MKLLYSYFHLCNSMEIGHLQQLRNCGLVYCKSPDPPRDWELVLERQFMFNQLLQTAASNQALFSLYDIGGAQELRFSDCCHRGEIRATCLGSTCHTITGTRPKLNIISFTCSHFCQQTTIGQQIQLLPSGQTCCLIKLAINHPAIDFIIYKNLAGVQARETLLRVCNVKNQPPSFGKLTFIPCRTPWYLNKRTLKVQILQLVWQKCSQGQRLS